MLAAQSGAASAVWHELVSLRFYEYYHGDNGAGFGASHQTGWTGVVARLMQYFALVDAPSLLAQGNSLTFQDANQKLSVQ